MVTLNQVSADLGVPSPRTLPPMVAKTDGKMAENILYFARVLRGAGIKIGPSDVVESVRALMQIGRAHV